MVPSIPRIPDPGGGQTSEGFSFEARKGVPPCGVAPGLWARWDSTGHQKTPPAPSKVRPHPFAHPVLPPPPAGDSEQRVWENHAHQCVQRPQWVLSKGSGDPVRGQGADISSLWEVSVRGRTPHGH